MATFKVVILPHQSKTDKRFTVRIRLTHHRQCAFLRTVYRVRPDEVTAGGRIKTESVRHQLSADIVTMEGKIAEMGIRIDNYSTRELGDILEKEIAIKSGVLAPGIDFFVYGQGVIESMREKQPRQADNYHTLIAKMKQYTQSDRLEVNAITKRWLSGFETWMFTENKLSATSVNNNMRCLRAIYNRARDKFNDEERGEIPIPFYPFGKNKYTIPAPAPSKSRALDARTIRMIYDYTPTQKRDEIARDVFLFSFYMMGMNLPDIYKCTKLSFSKNRITYVRSKVEGKRGADAEISVQVPPEADEFIRKYADPTKVHLFSFHSEYSTTNNFTKAVNTGLAKIAEDIDIPALTLYYARHSFATIAHSDYGASIAEVGACLNHAAEDHRVTLVYTRKDYTRNDQIQRGVIDIVNRKNTQRKSR